MALIQGRKGRSSTLDFAGTEPDCIVFKRRHNKQRCYLIELKDGDAFDTKKAAAERTSMHSFISKNAQHVPYIVSAHFCCFNQDDRSEIVKGFKVKITADEAMTGREFCDLLEIKSVRDLIDRWRGQGRYRLFDFGATL